MDQLLSLIEFFSEEPLLGIVIIYSTGFTATRLASRICSDVHRQLKDQPELPQARLVSKTSPLYADAGRNRGSKHTDVEG